MMESVGSDDGPLSTAQLSALCIIYPNKNWIGVLFVLIILVYDYFWLKIYNLIFVGQYIC